MDAAANPTDWVQIDKHQGVWEHITVGVLLVSQGKSAIHTKVGDATAKHLRHDSFGFSFNKMRN